MKNYILTWVLAMCATIINAAPEKTTAEWLDELDASLARRSYFEKLRTDRIQSLKDKMAQTSADDDLYPLKYELYTEYKSYCYDSAFHYSYECLHLATSQHYDQRIAQSKLAIAFSLISAGILSEAHDVIKTISRDSLSGDLLSEYYDMNSKLWRTMADYVNQEPFYTTYITLSNTYLASVKQIIISA